MRVLIYWWKEIFVSSTADGGYSHMSSFLSNCVDNGILRLLYFLRAPLFGEKLTSRPTVHLMRDISLQVGTRLLISRGFETLHFQLTKLLNEGPNVVVGVLAREEKLNSRVSRVSHND